MGWPARAPDLRAMRAFGPALVAQTRNARPGASLERPNGSRAASDPLTAESVENPGMHLVVLLEGRHMARRITGHLIRIDLTHGSDQSGSDDP